jgi:hypothetical protein
MTDIVPWDAPTTDPAVLDQELSALSPKERALVQHWCGSAKETWKSLQEYPGEEFSKMFVKESLKDIRIVRAIRLNEGMGSAGVLNKNERQQFWSNVIMDDDQKMGDRLKASELLGRVAKDFSEVVEISASTDFAKSIAEARARAKAMTCVDVDAEVIEEVE